MKLVKYKNTQSKTLAKPTECLSKWPLSSLVSRIFTCLVVDSRTVHVHDKVSLNISLITAIIVLVKLQVRVRG